MNNRATRRCGRRVGVIVGLLIAVAVARPAFAQPCIGDCRGVGHVAISDLILAVNIVLGLAALDECPALGVGPVGISHLIASVNNALCACKPCPTRPPTATATVTPTITAIPTPTGSPTPEAIVSTWRESTFMVPSSTCPRQLTQEIRAQLTGVTFEFTVTQIGEQVELSDGEGNTQVGTIDADGNLETRDVATESQGACMVTVDTLQTVNLSQSPATSRSEVAVSTRNCPTPINCSLVLTSRWTRTSPALRARGAIRQRGSAFGPIGVVIQAIR